MLFSTDTLTDPASSKGGIVLYHNQTVFVARARSYPKKVTSTVSQKIRRSLNPLSIIWENPVTDAQRIAWGNYAYNSPLLDSYGNPRYIRGYAQFMRANRPRYQFNLPIILDGPTTAGFPPYTLPQLVLSPDNTRLLVVPDAADDWANETGAFMLLWISRPTAKTITWAPEVYSALTAIPGQTGSPPDVQTLDLLNLPSEPIRVWVRSAVTRADGRYTSRS